MAVGAVPMDGQIVVQMRSGVLISHSADCRQASIAARMAYQQDCNDHQAPYAATMCCLCDMCVWLMHSRHKHLLLAIKDMDSKVKRSGFQTATHCRSP